MPYMVVRDFETVEGNASTSMQGVIVGLRTLMPKIENHCGDPKDAI